MNEIIKQDGLIKYLEALNWKIDYDLKNFLEMSPPKNFHFNKNFSVYLPKKDSVLDYKRYIQNLYETLSRIYQVDTVELQEMITQFNNEHWTKKRLLLIMKSKTTKSKNYKIYFNQSIEFGEAYIIISYISYAEQVTTELFMIMIDIESKIEFDGLIVNYPPIYFDMIKEDSEENSMNDALETAKNKLEQHYFKKFIENRPLLRIQRLWESINPKLVGEKSLIGLVLRHKQVLGFLERTKCEELSSFLNTLTKLPVITMEDLKKKANENSPI